MNGIAGASLVAAIYALNIPEEDKKELVDFAKQEEVINSQKNTNRDLKIKLFLNFLKFLFSFNSIVFNSSCSRIRHNCASVKMTFIIQKFLLFQRNHKYRLLYSPIQMFYY